MSTETHDLEVQQDFLKDGYDAFCSCGWEKEDLESMEAANEAFDDHCDAVFMEATMKGGE